MAKKWCGFLPQNDSVRHKWDILVRLQDENAPANEKPVGVAIETDQTDEEGTPVPIVERGEA